MVDSSDDVKKRQKRIANIAICGIVILLGFGILFFDSGKPAPQLRRKTDAVSVTLPGSVDDRDLWRAQQAARETSNEQLIEKIQRTLERYKERDERLEEALKKLEKEGSDRDYTAFRQSLLADPEASQNNNRETLGSPTVTSDLGRIQSLNDPISQPQSPPRRELEIIQFSQTLSQSEDGKSHSGKAELLGFPTNEKARRYAQTDDSSDVNVSIQFLPAGSFVRVAMLNGVDAPTGGQAQSNPLPVAFHVIDTASLANKHNLDIRDCRFIAAAWGDLSSERMMGRTETLTCIINDETIELPIKGTIIGEDGKAGVRGRLVTKQGQLLANALFSGAISGVGDAFKMSSLVTSIGGGGITQAFDANKLAEAGLGGGLSKAADTLAQYYLKAADKIYPVIETDGGRTVEILITKGATYETSSLGRENYRALLRRPGMQRRRFAQ